jgi:acyl-CoA thioester hydrolase
VETAKLFNHYVRVSDNDIDLMQHVNNVVYLKYIQDASAAHWYAVAPSYLTSQVTWVVRRHEIDYLRPAFVDEDLVVRTWVGKATAATCERFAEIYRPSDGQILTRTRSVWVILDVITNRPRRIDEQLLAYFH